MNPKIHEDETLSKATDRLFCKDQVWLSCHQLCIHAEYFGAYWGFMVTCNGMTIVCNQSGVTQILTMGEVRRLTKQITFDL